MSSLHKSAASIGFYGDDLDPSKITKGLGEPTVGVQKGSNWLTQKGAEKVARTGFWRLAAEYCEPADLDGQINTLLDQLSNDLPAWRAFAKQFRGRVFCGLFLDESNEGSTLQPETLARIGERGLLLDLDIYGQDMPD